MVDCFECMTAVCVCFWLFSREKLDHYGQLSSQKFAVYKIGKAETGVKCLSVARRSQKVT
jgi:hypothetical protein